MVKGVPSPKPNSGLWQVAHDLVLSPESLGSKKSTLPKSIQPFSSNSSSGYKISSRWGVPNSSAPNTTDAFKKKSKNLSDIR